MRLLDRLPDDIRYHILSFLDGFSIVEIVGPEDAEEILNYLANSCKYPEHSGRQLQFLNHEIKVSNINRIVSIRSDIKYSWPCNEYMSTYLIVGENEDTWHLESLWKHDNMIGGWAIQPKPSYIDRDVRGAIVNIIDILANVGFFFIDGYDTFSARCKGHMKIKLGFYAYTVHNGIVVA